MSIIVKRKVRLFVNPQPGQITSFQLFKKESGKEEYYQQDEINIDLGPAPDLAENFDLDYVTSQLPSLSFSTTATDIKNLFNEIKNIFLDPLILAQHLKPLDIELGNALKNENVLIDEERLKALPLIAGFGNYIPDAPNCSYDKNSNFTSNNDHTMYLPLAKGLLLNKVLQNAEIQYGLNTDFVCKFVGVVEKKYAQQTLLSNHLFTENVEIGRMFSHGSMTHRLAIFAIHNAIQNQAIKTKLTIPQLIELLTVIKPTIRKIERNLWDFLLDSLKDTHQASKNEPFNPKHFTCSARSPFTMNSLLLCFGANLGLPHLQFYMLDSHYKTIYRRIARAKDFALETNPLTSSYDHLYFHCIKAEETSAPKFGAVGQSLFFNYNQSQALQNPKYEYVYPSEDKIIPIVKRKKEQSSKPFGYYPSWFHYLSKKPPDKIDKIYIAVKLIEKYKLSLIEERQDVLNKVLRRAAALGNYDDIKLLLDNTEVEVNAQSNKSGHTALHKVVIHANKSKENIENYQKCFALLIKADADTEVRDKPLSPYQRRGKEPMDYDGNHYFATLMKAYREENNF